MRLINIDMDGVLGDFEREFVSRFKIDSTTIDSPEVCRLLATCPDFFLHMPVIPGARDFVDMVWRHHPVILTSCPMSCFDDAVKAKRAWARKHFGDIPVIPVPGSRNKHLYLQNRGDILIDDWRPNCEDWRAAGGKAIKFENWTQASHEFFTDAWKRRELV